MLANLDSENAEEDPSQTTFRESSGYQQAREAQAGDTAGYQGAFKCVCGRQDLVDWICCDSKDCPVQWYHLECVGLTEAPYGFWICPRCAADPNIDPLRPDTSKMPLFPNLVTKGVQGSTVPQDVDSNRNYKPATKKNPLIRKGVAIKKKVPTPRKKKQRWVGWQETEVEDEAETMAKVAQP